MINYLDIGDSEEVLVLVAGLGQSIRAFTQQMELTERYRLIIIDYIGEPFNMEITVDNITNEIIRVLDVLHINKAHFAGVSLGGALIQNVFKDYPERVLSLILSNSLSYIQDDLLRANIAQRRYKLATMGNEEYIEDIIKSAILFKNEEVMELCREGFILNRDTYIETASLLIGKDFTNIASSIDIPCLLIGGLFDSVVPVGSQVLQRWLIPKSQLRTFTSGHLTNIECAEGWNNAVKTFLKKIENKY